MPRPPRGTPPTPKEEKSVHHPRGGSIKMGMSEPVKFEKRKHAPSSSILKGSYAKATKRY